MDRINIHLTLGFLKPGLTDNPESFPDPSNEVVMSYISCVIQGPVRVGANIMQVDRRICYGDKSLFFGIVIVFWPLS